LETFLDPEQICSFNSLSSILKKIILLCVAMDFKRDVDEMFHSADAFSSSVLERAGNNSFILGDNTEFASHHSKQPTKNNSSSLIMDDQYHRGPGPNFNPTGPAANNNSVRSHSHQKMTPTLVLTTSDSGGGKTPQKDNIKTTPLTIQTGNPRVYTSDSKQQSIIVSGPISYNLEYLLSHDGDAGNYSYFINNGASGSGSSSINSNQQRSNNTHDHLNNHPEEKPKLYEPWKSNIQRTPEERKKIHKLNEQTYRNNFNNLLYDIDRIIPKLRNGELDLQKAFIFPTSIRSDAQMQQFGINHKEKTGGAPTNNKANILKEAISFIVEADKHIEKLLNQVQSNPTVPYQQQLNQQQNQQQQQHMMSESQRQLRLQELLYEAITSSNQPAFRNSDLQEAFGSQIDLLRSQLLLMRNNRQMIATLSQSLGLDPNQFHVPFPAIIEATAQPSMARNNSFSIAGGRPNNGETVSLHDLLNVPRSSQSGASSQHLTVPGAGVDGSFRRSFSSSLTPLDGISPIFEKGPIEPPETITRKRSIKRNRRNSEEQ
jgi:hypothetical protein